MTKSQRKKYIHYFKTTEYKEKLRISIESNLKGFISNRKDFKFKHSVEQLLSPCKKTRGKRDKITRPQNAFILYRKDIHDEIKEEHPYEKLDQISKIIGERWANSSYETKNRYTLLAELGRRVHRDIFPNYKFIPKSKENKKKKSNITPENFDEKLQWLLSPSIIELRESQPSSNEHIFSFNSNIPQENYDIVNMPQETQVINESQYLCSDIEILNLFQSNEQEHLFNLDFFNYVDYEMQPTEILPFDNYENFSIDTTLSQDFNSNSIETVNSNSLILDSTFIFDTLTNEQLNNYLFF
ncbi:11432_t:CDS:1 [Scutellospora calospora]|uniref:11432_t:CDS:1 n=1 Tax=Scutellospora calospora TaxID=85575 RepID=A0ACA9LDU5_9GLOM|nr:11432_t:CDS:1 [Scutellospora calospora]